MQQCEKLRRAAVLNEAAALKSCSWGAFQIMGADHASTGHADVAAFVTEMNASSARQLGVFVAPVTAVAVLAAAIAAKDWARFARRYDGPAYRDNRYDTKMAEACRRFASAGVGAL